MQVGFPAVTVMVSVVTNELAVTVTMTKFPAGCEPACKGVKDADAVAMGCVGLPGTPSVVVSCSDIAALTINAVDSSALIALESTICVSLNSPALASLLEVMVISMQVV